jgi:hypothetical protein
LKVDKKKSSFLVFFLYLTRRERNCRIISYVQGPAEQHQAAAAARGV